MTLTLAKLVGVEVYLPKAAERELETHMLRQWTETFSKLVAAVNALKRSLPQEAIEKCSLSLPGHAHVEQAYRKAVNEIKIAWNIRSVPLMIRPVSELLEMAINHEAPFTDKGAGFQDALIYLSVIEHLKQKSEHAAVFISQDRVFKGDGIKTMNAAYGVKIETCENLQQVIKVLEERLDVPTVQTAWQAERELVRQFLTSQLPAMPSWLDELLSPQSHIFNFVNWTGNEPVRLIKIKLNSIVQIETTPPPVVIKNGKPYHRDKYDRIKIGAQIDAKLHILVRLYMRHDLMPAPNFIRDVLTTTSTGPSDALIEEEIAGLVEVEGMGWVFGDEIRAFNIYSARFIPAQH